MILWFMYSGIINGNLIFFQMSIRILWSKARAKYFSSGVNKRSLDCIERAAFFVTLDEDEHCMKGNDSSASLDRYAKSLLHGKCYDRYFHTKPLIFVSVKLL